LALPLDKVRGFNSVRATALKGDSTMQLLRHIRATAAAALMFAATIAAHAGSQPKFDALYGRTLEASAGAD